MSWFFRCPHCGQDAFQFKEKPVKGEVMKAANIIHVDNPKAGDEIHCGNCKAPISEMWLNNKQLVEHD